MTATSSLPLAAMEAPAPEDSMEMASPYDRQADDFDIDIDLMEDHVSNMDSDMMGADDIPITSQPSLFQNETNYDADMADESHEGSMVDADNIAEEDYDVDVHFEETYETEMLEDDQDETVDAAPSGVQPDVPEPTQDVPVEEPVDTPIEESIQEAPVIPDIPQEGPSVEGGEPEAPSQNDNILGESNELASAGPENAQENEAAQSTINHDHVEPCDDTNQSTEPNSAHVEEQHVSPASPSEKPEAPEVKSHEIADEHAKHAETHSVHETEDQGTDDESLHPIKVLYQENEISLFPPLEGDSAETFFLHDENVAYDNVGVLFSSLRGVLLDNVAGNEVLVIDIDALGIQLTEDSSYTSKITLHQILDIYLRLCHNDGIDEPEAMYVTLSSKLAVDSELASLDAAANEGKGLSQIESWDEFNEADLGAEEVPTNGEATNSGEEPHQNEAQNGESNREEAAGPEGPAPPEDDSEEGPRETGDFEQHGEVEYEAPSDQAGNHQAAIAGNQDESVEDQTEEHNTPEGGASFHELQDKNNFGSETGTASTSTVAPNDHVENGTTDVEDAVDYHNLDDHNDPATGTGDDDFDEDDFTVQHEADEEEPAVQDEVPHEDETQSHGESTAAHQEDADPADVSQYDVDHTSYDQPKSTVQNVDQDSRPSQERTPEPEDDLLGIAEDVMQTPAMNRHTDVPETLEGEVQDEFPEDALADSVNGEGADDGDFGDYYPDFEVTEAITEATELGDTDPSPTDSPSHDNPSTKRSREDEEWDLTDATTPDTKRRRS
ncbi:hypothetical protein N7492_007280 [Penicillium capsulatum]|uniref:Uncharacterized protein n=1 Tax=Penicillium capsulatum TaxID=69766 RepID=A0A9W9HZJ2_9EURO|nr:hypothetical protein N7492_007280 [Penicillium capsulatum]KAJ6117120.1 hypothetical protein N7512_006845 [Penicillium capsulatum]